MTIIQPDRQSVLLNRLLFALVALIIVSALSLVWLYVRLVNINHNLASARTDLVQVETQSAELKEKIFGLLSGDKLQALAQAKGLVQDKDPQYLQASPSWSLASHF